MHLSEPVTDVDVVMGIQFCSVNQNKNANLKKKQQYSRYLYLIQKTYDFIERYSLL